MPMTATAGPVVFCSHTSADKPRVKEFAERLRLDGIEAWVDGWEIDSGDDFVTTINDGLERCTAGLVFFSRTTPRSRWVSAAISVLTTRAVHGLRVIPVLFDDDADLPPLLEHYLRRSIDEYEAIRDTLLDRRSRPTLGPLPEQLWSELLIGGFNRSWRLRPTKGPTSSSPR
ncbi:MAG: toll/interleukin-1 receptor domain-containing protein [Pseudonocardia sp.]